MKPVTIVTGLAYGDEGKGSAVDALARRLPSPPVVIRHNGGPQAAHNVVLPGGMSHTFSQWGSGTLAGARTHLSQHMLVNPLNLGPEAKHLRSLWVPDPFQSLTVAASAPIITPYHVAVNRAREWARGGDRHGSCGQGVGELRQDLLAGDGELMAIRASDLKKPLDKFVNLLTYWRNCKQFDLEALNVSWRDEEHLFSESMLQPIAKSMLDVGEKLTIVSDFYVQELLGQGEHLIFEGAQGVLLDEWFGFHPYTTWSTTTTDNAFNLLGDYDRDKVHSLGVIRSYGTRHGPGPFVTESSIWQPAEPHNGTGDWQGTFRTGWFDVPAFKYALRVVGPMDGIVLTHVDTIQQCQMFPICIAYEWPDRFSTRGAFTVPEIKINPNLPGDDNFLDWQGKLTEEIMAAEPVYEVREWHAFAGSEYLSDVPVYMKSCGPTFQDKVFI